MRKFFNSLNHGNIFVVTLYIGFGLAFIGFLSGGIYYYAFLVPSSGYVIGPEREIPYDFILAYQGKQPRFGLEFSQDLAEILKEPLTKQEKLDILEGIISVVKKIEEANKDLDPIAKEIILANEEFFVKDIPPHIIEKMKNIVFTFILYLKEELNIFDKTKARASFLKLLETLKNVISIDKLDKWTEEALTSRYYTFADETSNRLTIAYYSVIGLIFPFFAYILFYLFVLIGTLIEDVIKKVKV